MESGVNIHVDKIDDFEHDERLEGVNESILELG